MAKKGNSAAELRILSELEKKVHGIRPAYAKSGYGILSDGIFASLPKKIVKMSMVRSGWNTAQPAPSAVCL